MRKAPLVLVVGPSGSGKDTLIAGAKADPAVARLYRFPTRDITRPAGPGAEVHRPIGDEAFRSCRDRGGYSLSWRAHDCGYGIPRSIEDELAAGFGVVVNVSRSVVPEARARFGRIAIVSVTAAPKILRRRLLSRGREGAAALEARLARSAAFRIEGPDVTTLDNDGPKEEALSAFVSLLTTWHRPGDSARSA